MDLAQALMELWHRKLLLFLGLLLAGAVAAVSAFEISGFPPKAGESKAFEYGVASTQLLVDQRESPVGDLRQDFGAVAARAAVYSRLLNTVSVKRRIAKRLGLPPESIITGGTPVAGGPDRKAGSDTMSRSNELVGEGGGWRLQTSVSENSPLITIYAQAPSAEEAAKLANASYRGLGDYLTQMQDRQHVPERDRAELRQLGTARGAAVNEGAGKQAAGLAFIGVFVGWCLLVLLLVHLRQSLREQREREARARTPEASEEAVAAVSEVRQDRSAHEDDVDGSPHERSKQKIAAF